MTRLDDIRTNSGFLAAFTQALSYFYASGVLEVLREFGKVKFVAPETPNYPTALAAQAEYSRGYNQAIDDLLLFRERYIDPLPRTAPPLDFGAIDRALAVGDLTKEEADELRSSSDTDLDSSSR